jgi:hypothetical protein
MRDIRPDLRERLVAIARERARLDQMEAGIKALIQQEDQQHRVFLSFNGADGVDANESGTPLTRAIRAALSKHSLSVEELKTAVKTAGYDFGQRSPGRVLHWGLVGMGTAVEKVGDKWRLKEGTQ